MSTVKLTYDELVNLISSLSSSTVTCTLNTPSDDVFHNKFNVIYPTIHDLVYNMKGDISVSISYSGLFRRKIVLDFDELVSSICQFMRTEAIRQMKQRIDGQLGNLNIAGRYTYNSKGVRFPPASLGAIGNSYNIGHIESPIGHVMVRSSLDVAAIIMNTDVEQTRGALADEYCSYVKWRFKEAAGGIVDRNTIADYYPFKEWRDYVYAFSYSKEKRDEELFRQKAEKAGVHKVIKEINSLAQLQVQRSAASERNIK